MSAHVSGRNDLLSTITGLAHGIERRAETLFRNASQGTPTGTPPSASTSHGTPTGTPASASTNVQHVTDSQGSRIASVDPSMVAGGANPTPHRGVGPQMPPSSGMTGVLLLGGAAVAIYFLFLKE